MNCVNCHNPIQPTRFKGGLGIVGERPGKQENWKRENFVGRSGQELDMYLGRAGYPRSACYIDNVLACYLPDDPDPTPTEIEGCRRRLITNLLENRPQVILSMGAFATRWFLGPDAELEFEHGIPHKVNFLEMTPIYSPIIVPSYHPAFALRETFMMQHIMTDVDIAVRVLRGEHNKVHIWDPFSEPLYRELTSPFILQEILEDTILVGMDTETDEYGNAVYVTFSVEAGTGYLVDVKQSPLLLKLLAQYSSKPSVTTILHNTLFDLPVLRSVGIIPSTYYCTMVMAYHTQVLPQGLKPLAYRLLGMKMNSFEDVCRPYAVDKAIEYLIAAGGREWGKPDKEFGWKMDKKRGELVPHVRQPQPIEKKIWGIIRDYGKDEKLNVFERWDKIDGREMVESEMGAFPQMSITLVPKEKAIPYAACDADACLRIYPILKEMLNRE
jgi:uracil-DNA glycosylase family 4